MKNNLLSLAVLVFVSASLSSCEKDPTLKDQLIGNWISTKVKAGNEDLTTTTTFQLLLEKSAEFDLDVTNIVPLVGQSTQSYTGDWSTDETKQEITLVYDGSGDTKTWDIISVADNAVTAELVENNIRYMVEFERQ